MLPCTRARGGGAFVRRGAAGASCASGAADTLTHDAPSPRVALRPLSRVRASSGAWACASRAAGLVSRAGAAALPLRHRPRPHEARRRDARRVRDPPHAVRYGVQGARHRCGARMDPGRAPAGGGRDPDACRARAAHAAGGRKAGPARHGHRGRRGCPSWGDAGGRGAPVLRRRPLRFALHRRDGRHERRPGRERRRFRRRGGARARARDGEGALRRHPRLPRDRRRGAGALRREAARAGGEGRGGGRARGAERRHRGRSERRGRGDGARLLGGVTARSRGRRTRGRAPARGGERLPVARARALHRRSRRRYAHSDATAARLPPGSVSAWGRSPRVRGGRVSGGAVHHAGGDIRAAARARRRAGVRVGGVHGRRRAAPGRGPRSPRRRARAAGRGARGHGGAHERDRAALEREGRAGRHRVRGRLEGHAARGMARRQGRRRGGRGAARDEQGRLLLRRARMRQGGLRSPVAFAKAAPR